MSLKQKTIDGMFWSWIDNFAKYGITFIVSIVLARLLEPKDFGLIGMITIFIAVSEAFINSGFSKALIRKNDCNDVDYSTVFYFNLIVGIIFYIILFVSAPYISIFFNETRLIWLIRILGLMLIIDSFTIIQRTILTKRLNFKLLTKISVISSISSGIVGITMAYFGYGVWSLVAQRITQRALASLFLWIFNRWKPLFVFSKSSFKELFAFGNKLLISNLINTIYRNVYLLIIGKYFSAADLGYFTRANQFQKLPSENISNIIQRVTYPVLSELQNDKIKLKNNYKKLIKSTMLITFTLMIGMASIADNLIITLIGEKWIPSVEYLQLLCFAGMFYPLHALNLNVLQVVGRSDTFLIIEIIKKVLAVPVIIIGVIYGIKVMIIGMIVTNLISYFINSYSSGKHINYSARQQIIDIFPSFIIALTMGGGVYIIGLLINLPSYLELIIQILIGGVYIIGINEISKRKDYLYIKTIITSVITKRDKNSK